MHTQPSTASSMLSANGSEFGTYYWMTVWTAEGQSEQLKDSLNSWTAWTAEWQCAQNRILIAYKRGLQNSRLEQSSVTTFCVWLHRTQPTRNSCMCRWNTYLDFFFFVSSSSRCWILVPNVADSGRTVWAACAASRDVTPYDLFFLRNMFGIVSWRHTIV